MILRRTFAAFVLTASAAVSLVTSAALAADTGASRLTFMRVAGSEGGPGFEDGAASAARFNQPAGVAVDAGGNFYVADMSNHTIRKITPTGAVTTLAGVAGTAGFADGTGGAALFHTPNALAVDSRGNVFVSDRGNSAIRKITPGGTVITLAGRAGQGGSGDGLGDVARFSSPSAVAVDASGNVYVADVGNETIRKITASGIVSTIAGASGQSGSTDGNGSDARFFHPQGIAVDASGTLYVADSYNYTIRKVTAAGVVTTLAGLAGVFGTADGSGSTARFYAPAGLAADSGGNLYVADMFNQAIRKITPSGSVTTVAGQAPFLGNADGPPGAARFRNPAGITVDAGGTVYVADTDNHTIRRITVGGSVDTLAGLAAQTGFADGAGLAARFNNPSSVCIDSNGNVVVADTGSHTIRRIAPGGTVTTLAGLGDVTGSADGVGSGARFFFPNAVAADSSGNVYVADSVNATVRKVTPSGTVTTLAGLALQSGSADGTGSAARFNFPLGIAVDATGNVFTSDYSSFTIRKITPAGVVTTLAGLAGTRGSADGTGSAARFSVLGTMATDAAGNVYVADIDNSTIRKITPAGVVTTLAGLAGHSGNVDGTGADARFSGPQGAATDSGGNVYVTDTGNNAIRKITPAGVVTTLAGFGSNSGEIDGTGNGASFYQPWALTVDSNGTIWIAARFTNSIRMGKTGLADVAALDSSTGIIGVTRRLSASPNTATSWHWSVIRRPPDSTATIASESAANPTFTPDKSGLYTFRLVATRDGTSSITTVSLQAVSRSRAVRP